MKKSESKVGNNLVKDNYIASLLSRNNLGIKLDLGCGEFKEAGFVGMDVKDYPNVDIVHDLETYPWPLPDNCASLIKTSHVVEHINPANLGLVKFMNEAWRVCKPSGQFMISHPYAGMATFGDPGHIAHLTEMTWTYFDPLAKVDGKVINNYRAYKPKPWKIDKCFFSVDGSVEVLLIKRLQDKSYE